MGWIAAGALVVVLLIAGVMVGCPQYSVYEQRLTGEAELARASQNRKIRIQEAEAKMESAALEAQAEVAKAKGLAQANAILGQSLAGQEGERYLRYLWITNMEKSSHDTIYVPTEAGLPILESQRFAKQSGQNQNQTR